MIPKITRIDRSRYKIEMLTEEEENIKIKEYMKQQEELKKNFYNTELGISYDT